MSEKLAEVLKTIREIAGRISNRGWMLNERYLHHWFSHTMHVEINPSGDVPAWFCDSAELLLHPEWPTYKESTKLSYGRYRKVQEQYLAVDDGKRGGFLDFAIGDYRAPEIGIEFTLAPSWSNEAIVYDFVKLLDARNRSLTSVVSFNVILRHDGLPMGRYQERYQQLANDAYAEAKRRLGATRVCDDTRRKFFIISEIGDRERRHWYFDSVECCFRLSDEIPPILIEQFATTVSAP